MRLILIAAFLFFMNYSLGQVFQESSPKFPLKEITTYCQLNPDVVAHRQTFFYDSLHRISRIISYYTKATWASGDTSFVTYLYNKQGVLSSEIFFSLHPKPLSRIWIFKYDNKMNLVYEGYDSTDIGSTKYSYNAAGQLSESVTTYDYTKSVHYYSYDSKGNLIERSTDGGSENKYEYLNNKLVKEINGWGEVTYQYDESGLLITKNGHNGGVLEKNTYKKGRLSERWTYYSGIDPCFRVCCSQYIYRYSYY